MAEKFTKQLEIDVKIKDNELQEFQDDLKKMSAYKIIDDEETRKSLSDAQTKLREIGKLKDAIRDINVLEEEGLVDKKLADYKKSLETQLKEVLKERDKSQKRQEVKSKLKEEIKDAWKQGLKSAKRTIKDFLTGIIKDAWEEGSKIAEYGMSTSLISNASVREQALTYGLSESQNYAFAKAKERLGINSEEDLYFMNPTQKEKFFEYLEKYENSFRTLNQSGVAQKIQEFQLEFKDFKEDMMIDIMTFFADNKDLIKDALRVGADALKALVTITANILSVLGIDHERTESERLSKTSDIISNNSVKSSNTNNTINVNYNGVGKQDNEWILNKTNLTWKNVLTYINS